MAPASEFEATELLGLDQDCSADRVICGLYDLRLLLPVLLLDECLCCYFCQVNRGYLLTVVAARCHQIKTTRRGATVVAVAALAAASSGHSSSSPRAVLVAAAVSVGSGGNRRRSRSGSGEDEWEYQRECEQR